MSRSAKACRWALALVVVATIAPATVSSAAPRAVLRDLATTSFERWHGIDRIDGRWRGITVVDHIQAIRWTAGTDERQILRDMVRVRRQRCIDRYEPVAAHHYDAVAFRGDRTIYLRTVDSSCSLLSRSVVTGDGTFAFDDELDEATLDAVVHGRRYKVRWHGVGDTTSVEQNPAVGLQPSSRFERSRERLAVVTGSINGARAYAPCHGMWFAAACRLRSEQVVESA